MENLIAKVSEEYRKQAKELYEMKKKLRELEEAISDEKILEKDYFKKQVSIKLLKDEIKQKESFAEGMAWAREIMFENM